MNGRHAATLRVAPANTHDLDAAFAVIAACREALDAQGLFQWDPRYPDRPFFRDAIAKGRLFALFEQLRIVGVVVLDEWQPPEWGPVAWVAATGFLVIHAFAIEPRVQGRGYAKVLLAFCERFAAEQHRTSIHLDVFPENTAAVRFYERHGYSLRGEVRFDSKPVGHQQYRCYEKLIPPARAAAAGSPDAAA